MNEWRQSTWGEEVTLEYGKALRDYSDTAGGFRVFGTNGPIGWTDKSLAEGPGVAAEAKYAAMAGTAEKLEATLKKLKGTAQTCQWSRDQLHRSVEKDKASDRAAIVMFVCVDGRDRRHLWKFFTGGCRANPRCSGGLVGKLM